MPTDTGTDDRNRGAAAAVPVPVARGTAPVPGSTQTGTAVTSGSTCVPTQTGTDPATGTTPVPTQTGTEDGTGTGHGSDVTIHRAPRFHLPLIGRNRPAETEPAGTGTAGTDGHGSGSSGSSDTTAKGAKHSSGASKKWAFLSSPNFWLWVAILTINAIAVWMSTDGTLRGWPWAGLKSDDPHRFGLPVISEGMVIAWLLVGQLAVRMERSPYPYWGVAAGFAGIAVLLNTAFSSGPHPHREAAIFGVASVGSLALTFVKFYLSYVGKEVKDGLRAGAKPKVLLNVRTLEQPRIRWRAHLISGRIGFKAIVENGDTKRVPLTLDDVIALADLWREVHQDYRAKDAKGKRGDRQLAKRTAWDAVKAECGVKVYKREKLKVGRVEFVQPEREPIETAEEALKKFEREFADKPASPPAGPKPSRIEPTNRERSVAPTSPAPAGAAEIVDPQWFVKHAGHISLVQGAVPDWRNRELTVGEIQALGEKFPNQGLGNRGNATRIAACLRNLRVEAHQASK